MFWGSWLVLIVLVAAGIARIFADKYFTTSPRRKELKPLQGDAKDKDKPSLSVVIPCYNEQERLPAMLKDCIAYALSSNKPFRELEIIIADDCSTDKTAKVAYDILNQSGVEFGIVPIRPNRGKGFAVRSGFFAASGDYVLMADGDNATKFSDVADLYAFVVAEGVDISVGSRAHLESSAIASRTLSRTILMKAFHLVVSVTYFICTFGCRCRIRDTQCGFKLFHRRKCEKLFMNNRLERWAFDVELLVLAKRFGVRAAEVPVHWEEIPGSKVRLMGMVQMGLECLLMCFAYPFNMWSLLDNRTLITLS